MKYVQYETQFKIIIAKNDNASFEFFQNFEIFTSLF